jgi:hypothetical protein
VIAAPSRNRSQGPHLVYGFLTTSPNAVVEPIHPKAMPVILTTDVAAGITSFALGKLPAGAYIEQIIMKNLTANAVTGGIAIGSSSGTADIVASQACAANALIHVADASISKRVVSDTADTVLYATAVNAWNGANVTISIVFGYY